jgi:hypothetical protein
VTSAQRRELRAAEYRRLAIAAGALAETSLLIQVREKHEQAAAQWTALAILDELPTRLGLGRAHARKRIQPGPTFPQVDQEAP